MGTNFYWQGISEYSNDMDPRWHIGKRSAAGMYCWTCDTLFELHKCNAQPPRPSLTSGAAAVELGFAKPAEQRQTGITSVARFTWAQEPRKVLARCRRRWRDPIIVSEYGDPLTGEAFAAMLRHNCPIWVIDSIGEWFC